MHDFFGSELVDLLLADFTLNLALFSPLVCMGLLDLSQTRSSDGDDGWASFFFSFFGFIFLHVAEHLVLAHLVILLGGDLALQDCFELVDVVGQELRHLGHSESRDVGARAHGFYGKLLEIKDVVELLLYFV
jgi:hypothetical protein